ncbi:DUF5597 domain-containing protein [Microbacterium sp. NPDC096154]|uniref:GH35 family beta-galactosidase n=1 Tax=Microbacterium sp. NPDC096154 TaxID=3155549 RepID=UPI00331871DA
MARSSLPRLTAQGTATLLVVDDQPFLIRGGELGNSAAERAYLAPLWDKLVGIGLNTVIAPACWDLVEPEEGRFDWTTVDELIEDAARHGMRVVLLWFGSWKNSMSCYAPGWVKTDTARFPRSRDAAGGTLEMLTPFHPANSAADARAFAALMAHLRDHDTQRTVVMVQVENEIGMIPDARDHSEHADRAFRDAVPQALIHRLRTTYGPVARRWRAAGARENGSWEDVFGSGPAIDEVFMAWAYARYVERVTAAGKAELPLPMYTNAALIRTGYEPGQYPSAGPLPHLADVWHAGAPSLDFLAPDIYFPDFAHWTGRYADAGEPLFVPEALRSADAAVNALYAFGAHDAIGFSVFGVESIEGRAEQLLTESYEALRQLAPLIARHAGHDRMRGLLPPTDHPRQPHRVRLGDLQLRATFERTIAPSLADGVLNEAGDAPSDLTALPAGAIAIRTGPDELVVAGTGTTLTFHDTTPQGDTVGILHCEEGGLDDSGTWRTLRRLNGDETHQGRHLRLPPGRITLQRITLYRYR